MDAMSLRRRRLRPRASLGWRVHGLCASLITACALAVCAVPAAGAAKPVRPPALGATAATLIDAQSGTRLFGVAADTEHAIASTTKLMTALVVLEHDRLGAVFAAPRLYYPSTDSQIRLAPGERMSVHDLMLALLLPSADDAAEDLAYNTGHRSVARFVGMMNARARQLGLSHTHYSTPSGLDTPGNHSSASDLAKLASYLLRHQPFFARVVALRSAVLKSGARRRFVANRNDLVGRVPWITGVKTGHTIQAGYVLVGSGTRDGMALISAVLGTASEGARDANTLALLDYGFAAFHAVTPVRRGAVVARVPVRDRPGFRAALVAEGTVHAIVSRSAAIRTRVELGHAFGHELVGPLPRDAVVGRVVVTAGGHTLGVQPLLLAKALPAVSALAIAVRDVTRPGVLVPVALALTAVAVAGVVLRRRRSRRIGAQGTDVTGSQPDAVPTRTNGARTRSDRELARLERERARIEREQARSAEVLPP
jgi:D-alanyl-D-alanine carboxypeptidase (penicillin-binding protein 5/6)